MFLESPVFFPCVVFWETLSVTEVHSWRNYSEGVWHSDDLWVLLKRSWICFGRGVGLDDPQRSLPTPTILWVCELLLSKTNAGFSRISPKPSTMHQKTLWGVTSVAHVAVNTPLHYFAMQSVNGKCRGCKSSLALISAVCTHGISLILLLHRIMFKNASVLSLNQ